MPARYPPAGYLASRLAEYGLVLAAALVINFMLPRALPGGPLQTFGGEDVGRLSAADQAKILAQYGLDRPLPEQFVDYLGKTARLEFGDSFSGGQPVLAELARALPWTLLLVGTSIIVMALLGMVLGVFGALRRSRGKGAGLLSGVLVFDSMPAFWLGMLFITIFGVHLGVLPTFGAADPGSVTLSGVLSHLLLPVATLVLTGLGQFFLLTRSSMLTVLSSQPVQHARARGVPYGRLVRRHALRPALLPFHTILLTELGFLMSGALVVETVFAYPGVGRLVFTAIQGRDYPMMQGAFLVLTVSILVMNAIADLTYPLIDPRVRTGAQA